MVGVIIFSWIILCIVVGAVASSVGRSFSTYLLISIFLSPIIGFIILAIKGKATPDETLLNNQHIFYCPSCKKTFSAIGNNKSDCPNCSVPTKETTVLTETWRTYTDSQKEEMKMAFEQGQYLRMAPFMQPVVNQTTVSGADEIKKYKELLDNGVITQEEFEAKKKQLLDL
ncbi:SHOCT domain-containing protein [Butyrivibrio sp. MB2005]|uniref:SHOCT domain-containing protein n=1 Tax=Butyrivibrio sp. MB2005 TaxID=1280678 RepID=UPI000562E1FD|nr:SHOCT domain-containing protein [Butyrivibrio sp. MB2005]